MNQPVLATYRVYLSLLAAEPFASSTDQSTGSSSRHRPSTKSGNLTLCYSKRHIEIDRHRWFTMILQKKNVGFPYRSATKITREIQPHRSIGWPAWWLPPCPVRWASPPAAQSWSSPRGDFKGSDLQWSIVHLSPRKHHLVGWLVIYY